MDIDDEDERSTDVLVCEASSRVILHFDLDCFYAQVEMIRNPSLRNKPLGIQQKYIIVTCNYVARDHGVTKLMSITDAFEKCPQLVLVKGEDLTHYREMSYKVTDLLLSYCPLVERLGFDENFLDVTEMVNDRLNQMQPPSPSFNGHIFNEASLTASVCEYPRLAVGSQIAADLREAIRSQLGLTSCAGVATNKLLAKLVSGTHKPNQQTTLLPESTADIMGSLSGLRKVPGIGHSTGLRLKALGLVTIRDLQCFPAADLAREFGLHAACRLHNLVQGIDNSPVTPAGPPQSLSDEDSFKKMSSTTEVLQKVEELLTSLTDRMQKDGRQPFTFRLAIRRFSITNRYSNRESRQCPIPNHIGQKVAKGSCDALPSLVQMAMKLFHKMVEPNSSFHLTLINVCFSNLQSRNDNKGSIASFFSQMSPKKNFGMSQQQDLAGVEEQSTCSTLQSDSSVFEKHTTFGDSQNASSVTSEQARCAVRKRAQPALPGGLPSVPDQFPLATENSTVKESSENSSLQNSLHLPPDVDPDVFRHLPPSIQQELLASFHSQNREERQQEKSSACPSTVPCSQDSSFHNHQLSQKPETPSSAGLGNNGMAFKQASNRGFFSSCGDRLTTTPPEDPKRSDVNTRDGTYPSNVDPTVFSQLPPEMQQELLSEWKQQKPVLKVPAKKQGRLASAATSVAGSSKDRKAATKAAQANSLLNYFKQN